MVFQKYFSVESAQLFSSSTNIHRMPSFTSQESVFMRSPNLDFPRLAIYYKCISMVSILYLKGITDYLLQIYTNS